METNKKISFGFNKLVKKPLIVQTQPTKEKKVEFVECLEGQSIKVKDAVEVIEEPLVIPIKDNKRNLLDRIKEAKAKQGDLIKREIKHENERPDSELTIEELAARELIRDAQNRLENNTISSSKITVLPVKEDKITIDGEVEPTLEDYENIPISDYGMAMLRGMGWKEGMGIGRDPTKTASTSVPELRPKGLGLGATKIIKAEQPACDKNGKELILKKGSYAKIIAGLHKDNYCEVQGLDDEAGRVIVKTSLKGEILTLNEFLLVAVTKEEFAQSSKVLNNAKYMEYKEISERKLANREAKSTNSKKYSDDSEKESVSKSKYDRKQKDARSQKIEQSSRRHSSDVGNKLSSEDEYEKKPSRETSTYKSRSRSDDKDKYNNKHESRRGKHEKNASSSDSDDKHEKTRRDSSDSDSAHRKKRSKDKKKKKDRHRDRSRSRDEKYKSEKKKSKSKNRDKSYDSKEREGSRKDKSKSRHRKRSSSSSDDDHRRRK